MRRATPVAASVIPVAACVARLHLAQGLVGGGTS